LANGPKTPFPPPDYCRENVTLDAEITVVFDQAFTCRADSLGSPRRYCEKGPALPILSRFRGLRLNFERCGNSAAGANPNLQGTYTKGEAFASHSIGKESAGESRSLAANVALGQPVDFWQQSHRHCPPLSLRQRRYSRFQWGKPVQEVTARIGFQSPRAADDVRSVIVLAFAIVSPATESAPDKDLRRTDPATCDLD
jgi:hypothetical protein